MAASKIGGLFVSLDLNFAKFTEGLDKSRTKATTFGVAVGTVMANIATSFASMAGQAAASLPRLVSADIDVADQLNKTAQKTGIAVESLSALKHAAELADLPFEALTVGVGRLSKQMAEVQRGGDVAERVFNTMGIAALDSTGKLRPIESVLGDVAERFKNMQDGAGKSALALQIFGKAGLEMIPFLNQGRAGLAAMTEEARKLGIVINTETAQRAERFNDNLQNLQAAVRGVGVQLASALLPQLEKLSTDILQFIEDGEGVKKVAESFTFLFREIVTGGVVAVGIMKQLLILSAGIIQAGESVAKASFFSLTFRPGKAAEELNKATATIRIALEEMKDNFDLSKEKVQGIWDDLAVRLSTPPKLGQPDFSETEKAVSAEVLRLQKILHIPVEFGPVTVTSKLNDLIEETLGNKPIAVSIPVSATLEPLKIDSFRAIDIWEKGIRDRLEKAQEEFDFAISIQDVMDTEFQKELFAGAEESANVSVPKIKTKMEEIGKAGEQIGQAISSGIEDAMRKWEGFGKLAIGILNDIAATILRNSVTAPLTKWLGDALKFVIPALPGGGSTFGLAEPAANGLGTASFGDFLSGFRADGGTVQSGGRFMVGERGPEIFVPKTAGTIIPNDAIGGGGTQTVIQYIIDARGASAGIGQEIRRALRDVEDRAVMRSLRTAQELKLRTA